MTGQANWLPLTIIFLVLAGIALALLRDRINWQRIPGVRRRARCPRTGSKVEVVLAQDTGSGRFFGVRSCSGLSPPGEVHCNQACKDKLQPPSVQPL